MDCNWLRLKTTAFRAVRRIAVSSIVVSALLIFLPIRPNA